MSIETKPSELNHPIATGPLTDVVNPLGGIPIIDGSTPQRDLNTISAKQILDAPLVDAGPETQTDVTSSIAPELTKTDPGLYLASVFEAAQRQTSIQNPKEIAGKPYRLNDVVLEDNKLSGEGSDIAEKATEMLFQQCGSRNQVLRVLKQGYRQIRDESKEVLHTPQTKQMLTVYRRLTQAVRGRITAREMHNYDYYNKTNPVIEGSLLDVSAETAGKRILHNIESELIERGLAGPQDVLTPDQKLSCKVQIRDARNDIFESVMADFADNPRLLNEALKSAHQQTKTVFANHQAIRIAVLRTLQSIRSKRAYEQNAAFLETNGVETEEGSCIEASHLRKELEMQSHRQKKKDQFCKKGKAVALGLTAVSMAAPTLAALYFAKGLFAHGDETQPVETLKSPIARVISKKDEVKNKAPLLIANPGEGVVIPIGNKDADQKVQVVQPDEKVLYQESVVKGSKTDAALITEKKPEQPKNLVEFFLNLNNVLPRFIEGRKQRANNMSEEEKLKLFETIDGEENLNMPRVNIALLGKDSGDIREDQIDLIWGLPRKNEGLADQIHILSIGLNGSFMMISINRDLRIPELGGFTINSATYFDHRVGGVDKQGNPVVYEPEVMRNILENATGLPIDAMMEFNFDSIQALADTLFPEGLKIKISQEQAFISDVLVKQAYSRVYLEGKMKEDWFIQSLLQRVSIEEKNAFSQTNPNPSKEELIEFLLNQKVNFPPGKYSLSAEELIFLARARQLTIPYLPNSGAGGSSLAREEIAQHIIWTIIKQMPSLATRLDEIIPMLIETVGNLEAKDCRDLRILWEMKVYEPGPEGQKGLEKTLTLQKFLEEYLQSLVEMTGSFEQSAQLVKLGIQTEFSLNRIRLGGSDLRRDNGKLAIRNKDPRTRNLALEYWDILRQRVKEALE